MPTEVWKSTIIIYSPFNPKELELSELARDAESGESIVEQFGFEQVTDLSTVPEGVAEFLGLPEPWDGPERTSLVCLVTAQGTACDETCLCDQHDTPEQRASIEEQVSSEKHSDPAIPGSWTDCTGNDLCRCQVCGWQPEED